MANKRGRPKSKARLEREALDAAFIELPAHIPKMTKKADREMRAQYEESKRYHEDLIAAFSPIIPDRLILEVASIGDETMQGFEGPILEKYRTLMASAKNGQLEGAKATLLKAKLRADTVWNKNQDLANKIGYNHTIHSASQKILDEWDSLGDGGEKPSLRTIQNWYQKFIFK